MAKSKPPGQVMGHERVRKWDYERVSCGTRHNGFLAGAPWGAYVHFVNRLSRPCRSLLTDGALQCEHCAAQLVPEWRGYVPWYDSTYDERFSIITSDHYESVCEIDHLAHIVLSRGNNPKLPCVIRAEPWRTTPIPRTPKRVDRVSLSDFLIFVLWGDKELADWEREQQNKPAGPLVSAAGDIDRAALRLRNKQSQLRIQEARGEAIRAGDLASKLIREAKEKETPK